MGYRKILRGNTPVVLGRRLNTVVGAAQVYDVQIALKNLVFRLVLLHRDSELHLFDLIEIAFIPTQGCGVCAALHIGINDQVVHVLLRERRCTLTLFRVQEVVRERTTNADS